MAYTPDLLMNLLHVRMPSPHAAACREVPEAMLPRPAPVLAMPLSRSDALRILIVEDNPTNRKVIQKILERAGHQCFLARHGEEALDLIDKREFDALVLDIEGHELFAIRGAARTIERFSPAVLFEDNGRCRKYGVALDGVQQWLSQRGYAEVARVFDDRIWSRA